MFHETGSIPTLSEKELEAMCLPSSKKPPADVLRVSQPDSKKVSLRGVPNSNQIGVTLLPTGGSN